MTSLPRHTTVSAIVPTFEEGERLRPVLDVLTTYPGFTEVIVVDDSTTPDTGAVARQYPVWYLHHPGRRGKGRAMVQAVHVARGDILFFCDADIRGLSHNIITRILTPVQRGEVGMSVAVRGRGVPFITGLFARLMPRTTLQAGERAVTRALWEAVPDHYKRGYHIETGLNDVATRRSFGLTYHLFPALRQTLKEEKFGFWGGLEQRWHELRELSEALLYLSRYALLPLLPEPVKAYVDPGQRTSGRSPRRRGSR